jgi:hypothetical protein
MNATLIMGRESIDCTNVRGMDINAHARATSAIAASVGCAPLSQDTSRHGGRASRTGGGMAAARKEEAMEWLALALRIIVAAIALPHGRRALSKTAVLGLQALAGGGGPALCVLPRGRSAQILAWGAFALGAMGLAAVSVAAVSLASMLDP